MDFIFNLSVEIFSFSVEPMDILLFLTLLSKNSSDNEKK